MVVGASKLQSEFYINDYSNYTIVIIVPFSAYKLYGGYVLLIVRLVYQVIVFLLHFIIGSSTGG